MTQTGQKTLPLGWISQVIEDIPEIRIKGGSDKITEKLAVDEGTVRLFFSGDLQNKKKIQSSKKTTEYILEQTLKKSIEDIRRDIFVPPGSVLVALARNKAGAVGMHLEGDAVLNNAFVAFTPKPGTILPELLFYFFKNPRIRNRIKRDFMPGRKPYARQGDIKTLRINYPVAPEQQAQLVRQIEALLSEAERARDLLQTNQNIMDKLLESILREIFTEGRKNEWNIKKLNNLAEVRHTISNELQHEHERYPLVEADDIDRTVAEVQININTIGKPLPLQTKGFLLGMKPGIIFYASTFTSDTRWRSRVAMPFSNHESPYENVRCTDDLFALTVKNTERLSPRFLFWALQDPDVTALSTGNTEFKGNVVIKPKSLQALELRIPDLDEQQRICAYFDAYQEQLSQMKQRHRASQLAVDELERSILDQVFREE